MRWIVMILKGLDHNFQGDRLKLARIIRGLTLEEVSKELDISHQSISKYETGKSIPGTEIILQLSRLLGFSPSFFYIKDDKELLPQTSHFFRSGAAVPKKYKEQVKGKIQLIAYLTDFFESKLKIPQFLMPPIANKSKVFSQIDFEKIDELAVEFRSFLGLGNGPISNMTLLCEKIGVIVSFASLEHEKIDACTVFYNNRPFVILNEDRISSVRIRFNIAHELGHILLHSFYNDKEINEKSKHKRMEQEANRFASSFLMPESSFMSELSASGLDYLLILKQHWKASIQAIIYRAEELGAFSTDYALYLRQQVSRKKWRIFEPLDDLIPIERPTLFKQAFNLFIHKYGFSLDEILFNTGLKENELKKICSVVLDNNEAKKLSNNFTINIVNFPGHKI